MADRQTPTKVVLDWSKLLGFDQAVSTDGPPAEAGIDRPRQATLGAKFGTKPGLERP
jgi:hypothetical protein